MCVCVCQHHVDNLRQERFAGQHGLSLCNRPRIGEGAPPCFGQPIEPDMELQIGALPELDSLSGLDPKGSNQYQRNFAECSKLANLHSVSFSRDGHVFRSGVLLLTALSKVEVASVLLIQFNA